MIKEKKIIKFKNAESSNNSRGHPCRKRNFVNGYLIHAVMHANMLLCILLHGNSRHNAQTFKEGRGKGGGGGRKHTHTHKSRIT